MGRVFKSIGVLLVLCFFTTTVRCSRLVTCGSVVKLQNAAHPEMRLHSHEIRYARGSRQQSVTGRPATTDANSHWTVLGPLDGACARGDRVPCGSVVRLQHLNTKRWLHSHAGHASPLSASQEVSAFGEDGLGDESDHWRLVCHRPTAPDAFWTRDDAVSLRHVATGAYLAATDERFRFAPVSGQFEIVARHDEPGDGATRWTVNEGLFIEANAVEPRRPTRRPAARSEDGEL